MQRDRLAHVVDLVCSAAPAVRRPRPWVLYELAEFARLDAAEIAPVRAGGLSKDDLIDAEVSPTPENAPYLRVIWARPLFELVPRAVVFDVRRLREPADRTPTAPQSTRA